MTREKPTLALATRPCNIVMNIPCISSHLAYECVGLHDYIPPTFRISMHLRCEYKVLMSYLNRHSTLRFVFVMYITCPAHGLLEMFRKKTSDSLPNKRSPVRETSLANLDTACFKFVFVGFFSEIRHPSGFLLSIYRHYKLYKFYL
jgi:hypothetical protein